MKTLIDTIRGELRLQEHQLRCEADQLHYLGAIESAQARDTKANTLHDICEMIIAHQVRERVEREKDYQPCERTGKIVCDTGCGECAPCLCGRPEQCVVSCSP